LQHSGIVALFGVEKFGAELLRGLFAPWLNEQNIHWTGEPCYHRFRAFSNCDRSVATDLDVAPFVGESYSQWASLIRFEKCC
jgi:hypothetical protein